MSSPPEQPLGSVLPSAKLTGSLGPARLSGDVVHPVIEGGESAATPEGECAAADQQIDQETEK